MRGVLIEQVIAQNLKLVFPAIDGFGLSSFRNYFRSADLNWKKKQMIYH